MSTPKYFKDFPDITYTLRSNHAGREDTIKIKDFFRLLRIKEDLLAENSLYTPYIVKNGERPDQISYSEYGDEQFYWVILQINDITDFYNQWPLSQLELEEFITKKYGNKQGDAHHYETVETFDGADNLVLPGGLVVTSDFSYRYPSTPTENAFLTSLPVSVTNYEYEMRLNDKKGQIYILDPKYIFDYQRETTKYAKNLSQNRKSEIDISEVY